MLWKTEKETLSSDDILAYISRHEAEEVPRLDKLWAYYVGKNTKILSRKVPDANNPDNKIVVSYGRKIVNTFVGYGFRPRYTTYKAKIERDISEVDVEPSLTQEEAFIESLLEVNEDNNEHVKTSRTARNMGIFGRAYELAYSEDALPKFFCVDPREIIMLYDFSSEPKPIIGIRYYSIDSDYYKVEVYYKGTVELYDRRRQDDGQWVLTSTGSMPNFFEDIPIIEYQVGDEQMGVIEPVLSLIDAYDVLFSDSMNEFDRFAYAYLIMKGYGLTDPVKMKSPGWISQALAFLKRTRVFEQVPKDADISFLTKNIPSEFISFMSGIIREQIHIQSHVPDFTSERMSGASGIAIQRLLFDFENLVASCEAELDLGISKRVNLIATILRKARIADGNASDVVISHKRNVPLNLKEFFETANIAKQAGFSSYLCADIIPDDVIPDVQAELLRQKAEQEAMMPDIDQFMPRLEEEEETQEDDMRQDQL